jgi:hypothetical protein
LNEKRKAPFCNVKHEHCIQEMTINDIKNSIKNIENCLKKISNQMSEIFGDSKNNGLITSVRLQQQSTKRLWYTISAFITIGIGIFFWILRKI